MKQWADSHGLIHEGEKLVVTVQIVTAELPGRPALPQTEATEWMRGRRSVTTYQLTGADWQRIVQHFPQHSPERRLMERLQQSNNGPLHRNEIQAILGVQLTALVTRRISQDLLKNMARARGESLNFFFRQLTSPDVEIPHYYSIRKSYDETRY